ncbi:hypothetical protein J7L48_00780 [bacterium]|nr:hypothetical protein [bacterium]
MKEIERIFNKLKKDKIIPNKKTLKDIIYEKHFYKTIGKAKLASMMAEKELLHNWYNILQYKRIGKKYRIVAYDVMNGIIEIHDFIQTKNPRAKSLEWLTKI